VTRAAVDPRTATLGTPRAALVEARGAQIAPRASPVTSRDALGTPREALVTSRDALGTPREALVTSRGSLGTPKETLVTSRHAIGIPGDALVTTRGALASTRAPLAIPADTIASQCASVTDEGEPARSGGLCASGVSRMSLPMTSVMGARRTLTPPAPPPPPGRFCTTLQAIRPIDGLRASFPAQPSWNGSWTPRVPCWSTRSRSPRPSSRG